MSGTAGADPVRDEKLLRLVERFALLLTEAGMPRMPSRVFAFVLAADSPAHTASGLAAGLRVSPAAISGAVRYLQQVDLLVRDREPGARTDHYRLRDDLWYELYTSRLTVLDRWEEVLDEAATHLGPDRPGTTRMRDAQAFFAFLRTDFAGTMERWHDLKGRPPAGR